jgi:NAD(P)-dependent dehydrogenase (short-subunit alcohol dehydrogenase family)
VAEQERPGAAEGTNAYLPTLFTHGANTYLPDAYTTGFKTPADYLYASSNCTVSTTKSYLPTFDTNVFSVAAAAGTGTKMVQAQWLTTALDTATYASYTSAGRPTLSAARRIVIPTALQTGLGLAPCDSVGNLLSASAGQYSGYAASKAAVTNALIPLLTAINQSQAQTCL